MKRTSMLLLLIMAVSFLRAEKAPIKFGKVSIEELEMTVYEPDTSATAVVLCKYAHFQANDLTYRLTRRVKILKKAGTEYSEYTFPGGEDVNIRGRVYNLVNGEIIEEKLKRESIFKEKVTEDYYRIRVAMPNIKVGTVFDIEISHSLLPSEFAFQEIIPVKHAEIKLEEADIITYRKRAIGYHSVKHIGSNTYRIQEVPAFKKEAYMSSIENYMAKFEFDILNISAHDLGIYQNFTTSWDAVNDRLASDRYFGHAIMNGSTYLTKIKKKIEANYTTDIDKVKAAYNEIKKIKWNGIESVYSASLSLSTPYKEGQANSAEINMMLMQLLMKLDLPAFPVVISTRDNGRLHRFYPSYRKLNYMMVWTMIDDKEYVLDATEPFLPFGMLPKRCLNQHGRLVTNKTGKWLDLDTDLEDKDVIMYQLNVTDEMVMEGNISQYHYDYSALNFRKSMNKYASNDEYLNTMENVYSGLTIKDYSVENLDSLNKPVKEEYQVSIKNKIEVINDMALINPFLFEKIEDNPFKIDERKFPVDFAYKREKYLISKINIPEDYQFEEIPKPIKAVLPDKTATVLINYQALGNTITVTYRLKLNKPSYSVEEYKYLKSLYAAIINKHAEPIVIKRIQNEASL
ncbi:hypothetical protein [Carboxylicivirga marina]|uniref:DUF3857 domain-containing protein n=1 Tax=Carboxylicivirga marina TaxID=2800988 RepID=A0ABS1HQB2_9BACT|nr:hypothetical protein [Carboxylicivirga marina]MBK3519761.1 hypothetical protein [Carboxylicivirga marina]